MLDYYIREEYVNEVIKILDNIKHEGYYVKMAIAWTLAEIGIKFNNILMTYLESDNNSDNEKSVLRKMKIK